MPVETNKKQKNSENITENKSCCDVASFIFLCNVPIIQQKYPSFLSSSMGARGINDRHSYRINDIWMFALKNITFAWAGAHNTLSHWCDSIFFYVGLQSIFMFIRILSIRTRNFVNSFSTVKLKDEHPLQWHLFTFIRFFYIFFIYLFFLLLLLKRILFRVSTSSYILFRE